MKAGFYPRLALDGIRKNKRMYIPYLLTCIGMIMMFYILVFLLHSNAVSYLEDDEIIKSVLGLGSWVVAIFACFFLFYTNSFIIRRRKKEFGLYNILGMDKRNIGKILFWETLMTSAFSLAIGIFAGIILSKAAELGLVNIVHGGITYDLYVSPDSIFATLTIFGILFFLILLNGLRQIKFSGAVSLLRSDRTGEKPPKGNILLGIAGVVILAAAYYIAMSITQPIAALMMFFAAVVMVIIATYLIMISGSVLFCRILQKNKKYYYKPNHFVSVSSMVYRMKRNGAGLASICILATMVLVMISSTTGLYFGLEDMLFTRYPREMNLYFTFPTDKNYNGSELSEIINVVDSTLEKYNSDKREVIDCKYILVSGLLENGIVETDVTQIDESQLDVLTNLYNFFFVSLDDYNKTSGTNETLNDGETILFINQGGSYDGDEISFNNGNSFRITKRLDSFIENYDSAISPVPSIFLIVPDTEKAVSGLDQLADFTGNSMLSRRWNYSFDTGLDDKAQIELYHSLYDDVLEYLNESKINEMGYSFGCDGRKAGEAGFYSMYGGLFYLGIMLSIVFIFATILIIYYKQISEGYEDRSRFEIMQKVGMTEREIKKSINSQLLTVFFLPLALAALHLIFAFPMIYRLLYLFQLSNIGLFAFTSLISYCIFALFYTLVYRITSNAYFHIVSGSAEQD